MPLSSSNPAPTAKQAVAPSKNYPARGSFVAARAAPAFLICAAVLVPWAAILFLTLPCHYGASHWRLAWGGFDIALGIALATTAIAALRLSPVAATAATITGTLLVCDAWFDILTARGVSDVAQAMGEALLIELPLAALCFWIARNPERTNEQSTAPIRSVARTLSASSFLPRSSTRPAWCDTDGLGG